MREKAKRERITSAKPKRGLSMIERRLSVRWNTKHERGLSMSEKAKRESFACERRLSVRRRAEHEREG